MIEKYGRRTALWGYISSLLSFVTLISAAWGQNNIESSAQWDTPFEQGVLLLVLCLTVYFPSLSLGLFFLGILEIWHHVEETWERHVALLMITLLVVMQGIASLGVSYWAWIGYQYVAYEPIFKFINLAYYLGGVSISLLMIWWGWRKTPQLPLWISRLTLLVGSINFGISFWFQANPLLNGLSVTLTPLWIVIVSSWLWLNWQAR